jgi:hypothetical protein
VLSRSHVCGGGGALRSSGCSGIGGISFRNGLDSGCTLSSGALRSSELIGSTL